MKEIESVPSEQGSKAPATDLTTRGLSLIHERLQDPELRDQANTFFYKVTGPGLHAEVGRSESGNHAVAAGDAIATSKDGSTIYAYPLGAREGVNNPNSDTHLFVPIPVPVADASLKPPKT